MICKEGSIDVISIGGSGNSGVNTNNNSANSQQMHHGSAMTITNGHNTLQHRRKSQLITFSASSCDIKNSLSHEIIMVNNASNTNTNSNTISNGSTNNGSSMVPSNNRGSIVGSIGSGTQSQANNARLSFAEEDIMIIQQNGSQFQQQQHQQKQNGSLNGSGTGSASGCESVGVHNNDLEDEVFRRHSLEVDEEAQEALYTEEYGTHIETKSNNANDDSGGGSYEDSHALHSSLGGSNRNSLEKDDDDIDVDVISTDVSCYDQLLGSTGNTRNDEDEIATIVGVSENYTKLSKHAIKANINVGGGGGGSYGVLNGNGGGLGENGGIIYANPFMDDEGIAESGM